MQINHCLRGFKEYGRTRPLRRVRNTARLGNWVKYRDIPSPHGQSPSHSLSPRLCPVLIRSSRMPRLSTGLNPFRHLRSAGGDLFEEGRGPGTNLSEHHRNLSGGPWWSSRSERSLIAMIPFNRVCCAGHKPLLEEQPSSHRGSPHARSGSWEAGSGPFAAS